MKSAEDTLAFCHTATKHLPDSYKLKFKKKQKKNNTRRKPANRTSRLSRLFYINQHVLNQIIAKSNEHILPLCIGFIDYEQAFDTLEHFAIFEALRKFNINQTHVKILQNIYSQVTERIHLNNLGFDNFLTKRGVRQGDPISFKLFTAVMEEIFKKADTETILKESM